MIRFTHQRIQSSLILLLGAAFLAGCKDNTGPPDERVTTVAVASGDLQTAVVATALPLPLIAQALDAQSRPVSGATVTWQVVSGGGSITAGVTTTDSDGRATATWTLGVTAGEEVATATVGTALATFHATGTAGPAASVTVTPATLLLDAIDATGQLQVVARDAHDNVITGRTPTWTSLDPATATVSTAGVVTAVTPGTATVRATLDNVSGAAEVTVQPAPAFISLDPPAPQLGAVGATVQFQASAQDRNGHPVAITATDLTWASSDMDVVTVNGTGLATATGAGVAMVTATKGTVSGLAQVTVSQTVVSLSVSPTLDTLTTAQPTVQLVADARDANNQPIAMPALTWSSADEAVATVSLTGFVTAVANGETHIRVVSGNAADSTTITVRLNTAPSSVADRFATLQDSSLSVTTPGLLLNDTVGIPPATVVSFGGGNLGGSVTDHAAGTTVTFGTSGSLGVNADGSLAFTPDAGYTGSFTFQYRAQNIVGTADATVTIDVGVPPLAADDAYSISAGSTLTVDVPGVIVNDDRGFPLAAVVSFGGPMLGGSVTAFAAGQLVRFGVGGQVQLNPDGSLSFTPATGFTGDFAFQYRLSNGIASSDATITITVN